MNKKDPDFVVTFLTLRQTIGWVGLAMPFAVRLGALAFEHNVGVAPASTYAVKKVDADFFEEE